MKKYNVAISEKSAKLIRKAQGKHSIRGKKPPTQQEIADIAIEEMLEKSES